jgi:5-hydroxyisourate hydrolase
MGKLTTHVLDTSAGIPAAGVRIELREVGAPNREPLVVCVTDPTGRCADPLLAEERLRRGQYELTFYIGAYFRGRGVALPDPAFLEHAVIQIGIAHPEQHYHVPLLISPFSYSVYRGG